jgi:hypothetical protein
MLVLRLRRTRLKATYIVPCLSPSVADHPLRPATDRCLGRPLPQQRRGKQIHIRTNVKDTKLNPRVFHLISSTGAVKCVEIGKNAKGEGTLLGLISQLTLRDES